jgi:hypothetical protein
MIIAQGKLRCVAIAKEVFTKKKNIFLDKQAKYLTR